MKMPLTILRKHLLNLVLLACNANLFAQVKTGLENFLTYPQYQQLVQNKRVGLITNPTGVDSQLRSNIDLLYKHPNINLTALFAPEHGVRGNINAGEHLQFHRDTRTNLPIFPLYWKEKQPHPSHIKLIDTLIYDIQDIGARPYTYIWSLTKILQFASKYDKEVIVFDRPCPLGANIIDGPLVDKEYFSFLGLYPIPRAYGMTVGEFANYINTEHQIGAKLFIIPMSNYRRNMTWSQTGLPWVSTSPNIPSINAALCYSITGGLGSIGTKVYIGISDQLPFQVIAMPWIDANHMADTLNKLQLSGIRFRPYFTIPQTGYFIKQKLQGVQIHIIDQAIFRPVTAEIALMHYLLSYYPDYYKWTEKKRAYAIVIGNDQVQQQLLNGSHYSLISNSWQPSLQAFKAKRQRYLIYR